MRLIKKYGRPRMFEDVWALLRMYTVVLNYKLKQRGLPRQSQAAVMGAICSRFLLAMRSRIIDDYQEVVAANTIQRFGANLASKNRTDFPLEVSDIYGTGGARPNSAANDSEETDRPIRWRSGRRESATDGLSGSSGEVRRRGSRLARATDVWDRIREAVGGK